jgi:hypothetical protein
MGSERGRKNLLWLPSGHGRLEPSEPDSDIHTGGVKLLNSAFLDQQPGGDVLPIHGSALRREEEEDDDEIELVEDMTSFPPPPISGSSRSSKSQASSYAVFYSITIGRHYRHQRR